MTLISFRKNEQVDGANDDAKGDEDEDEKDRVEGALAKGEL